MLLLNFLTDLHTVKLKKLWKLHAKFEAKISRTHLIRWIIWNCQFRRKRYFSFFPCFRRFLNFHLFFFWGKNSSFSSSTLWQTEPSDALRIYFFSCLLQFVIRKYSEKQRLSINKFHLFVLRAIGKKLYWKTGVNTSRQMSVKNTIFLGLFKEIIF